MKPLEECYEVELYFVIQTTGLLAVCAEHWQASGDVSTRDYARLFKLLKESDNLQRGAVKQLERFGVVARGSAGEPTDAYWAWYDPWENWRQSLSDSRWEEVDRLLDNDLTEEQAVALKAECMEYNKNLRQSNA